MTYHDDARLDDLLAHTGDGDSEDRCQRVSVDQFSELLEAAAIRMDEQ